MNFGLPGYPKINRLPTEEDAYDKVYQVSGVNMNAIMQEHPKDKPLLVLDAIDKELQRQGHPSLHGDPVLTDAGLVSKYGTSTFHRDPVTLGGQVYDALILIQEPVRQPALHTSP